MKGKSKEKNIRKVRDLRGEGRKKGNGERKTVQPRLAYELEWQVLYLLLLEYIV